RPADHGRRPGGGGAGGGRGGRGDGGGQRPALRHQRRGRRRRACAGAVRRRGPGERVARRQDRPRGRAAQGGARLMLYHLLYPFHLQLSVLNVTRYITFRTAALVPTLLWADLTNVYIWIAVLTTMGFGAIGFADDYLKIIRRSHHGLLPRYKMGFQILIGLAVGV